jgi:hypothetical protein
MAGGGFVHVWGGIHHGGKTDLVVLQNYVHSDRYRHLLQTENMAKSHQYLVYPPSTVNHGLYTSKLVNAPLTDITTFFL